MKNWLMAFIMLLGTFGVFGLASAGDDVFRLRATAIVGDGSLDARLRNGGTRFDVSSEDLNIFTMHHIYSFDANMENPRYIASTMGNFDFTLVTTVIEANEDDKTHFSGLNDLFTENAWIKVFEGPRPEGTDQQAVDSLGPPVLSGQVGVVVAGGPGNGNNGNGDDALDCDVVEAADLPLEGFPDAQIGQEICQASTN